MPPIGSTIDCHCHYRDSIAVHGGRQFIVGVAAPEVCQFCKKTDSCANHAWLTALHPDSPPECSLPTTLIYRYTFWCESCVPRPATRAFVAGPPETASVSVCLPLVHCRTLPRSGLRAFQSTCTEEAPRPNELGPPFAQTVVAGAGARNACLDLNRLCALV